MRVLDSDNSDAAASAARAALDEGDERVGGDCKAGGPER